MAWSKNHVPKYRKHRASGQAIVTLNGRDYYLGPHGTKVSENAYDRLIGEWLQNGRHSSVDGPVELTVVELCARYWSFSKAYYRKDGKCTGEAPGIKAALRIIKRWYGKAPVSQFGPLALKAVRQRLVDHGNSRTYVNSQISRIKRMFKWGVSEEIVPPEVHQSLSTVAGLRKGRTGARETAPVLPIDDESVEATLPHVSPVVADMIRVQRLTGMRPAEVCLLRPCDLTRDNSVWTYLPSSHKTEHHGRERIIFIGPKAQQVLTPYLLRGAEDYCFQPRESEAQRRLLQEEARQTPASCGNRVGTNRKKRPKKQAGKHYSTNSYRRAIHYACDKAGIERWSPNRLRHSAATEIRREFGLEAAQIILGHSAADVTQVYAERDLAKGLEVAKKIG